MDLSNAKIKGAAKVEELVSIIDSGNENLLDEVNLYENSEADLIIAKKLLSVDANKLDLNGLAVLAESSVTIF